MRPAEFDEDGIATEETRKMARHIAHKLAGEGSHEISAEEAEWIMILIDRVIVSQEDREHE